MGFGIGMRLDRDDLEVADPQRVLACLPSLPIGFGQPFFERGFGLGRVGKRTIETSGESAGAACGSDEVFHDTNHSNRYGSGENTSNSA